MTPTGRETGEQLFGSRVLRCYLPYDLPACIAGFLAPFPSAPGDPDGNRAVAQLDPCEPSCRHAAVPRQRASIRALRAGLCARGRLDARGSCGTHGDRSANRGRRGSACGRSAQTRSWSPEISSSTAAPGRGGSAARCAVARAVSCCAFPRRARGGRSRFCAAHSPIHPGGCATSRPRASGEEASSGPGSQHPGRRGGAGARRGIGVARGRAHRHRASASAALRRSSRLLQARGLRFQRRSETGPVAADTRVVLGDSMGELFAYYAACDVAFIGGSLLPLGGQNLLEACAVGRPALVGPHTFNFAEATRLAVDAGAAIQVADAQELGTALATLLGDNTRRERMGAAGRALMLEHQGATARTLALLALPELGALALACRPQSQPHRCGRHPDPWAGGPRSGRRRLRQRPADGSTIPPVSGHRTRRRSRAGRPAA